MTDVKDAMVLRTFPTSVLRVEQVHARLRRVVLGGGELATFEPCGPDSFVYVLAPPPGRPDLVVDATFSWDRWRVQPEHERPVGAYYTVRRWDPERCEMELLVVLHPGGEGAAWAERTVPGDPVAVWGPRTAYEPPAATTSFLLVADETGLPAVAAIIESLPDGMPVRVIAEVGSGDDRQDLPARDAVDVTWLHRDGEPAGTTTQLLDAVRSLGAMPSTTYAWGGAESRTVTAVRRHLRDVVGLESEAVSMVGYWRLDADD